MTNKTRDELLIAIASILVPIITDVKYNFTDEGKKLIEPRIKQLIEVRLKAEMEIGEGK